MIARRVWYAIGMTTLNRRRFAIASAAGLGALALGCGRGQDVSIGSKNFQEQWILAQVIARLIGERTPHTAGTQDLAGTFLCHKALISGSLDAYVEYTGTALTAVLERPPVFDRQAALDQVRAAYAERFDLLVLDPLGFENTYAMLVRADYAEKHKLAAISDLAHVADSVRFGIGFEFYDRADGFPGLVRAYGLKLAQAPRQMELNLIYRALDAGEVDVIAGNSTDGHIAMMNLVMLADDRRYFPPYDAVPILRRATATKRPEVRDVLASLGGAISTDAMRDANRLVDGGGSVADAASALIARLKRPG